MAEEKTFTKDLHTLTVAEQARFWIAFCKQTKGVVRSAARATRESTLDRATRTQDEIADSILSEMFGL